MVRHTIGGEEEFSAIFHHVTYKRHKLTFRVEMSDGRIYETTHTVNGCDDYHESGWLGNPINDVDQFTRDIQAATFPDMAFFDEYAAWYFENEGRGIAPYVQRMIDGFAPLI